MDKTNEISFEFNGRCVTQFGMKYAGILIKCNTLNRIEITTKVMAKARSILATEVVPVGTSLFHSDYMLISIEHNPIIKSKLIRTQYSLNL